MENQSKTVVISGANRGIGQATTELFAKETWKVISLSRTRPHRLQSSEHWIPCDLSIPESIAQAYEQIHALCHQGIDALVNNAGQFERQAFDRDHLKIWRKLFEVNLFGSIELTAHLIPLIQIKKGSITQVSSTLGLKPVAGTSAYSASKAALINWTQCLALEMGKYQVRVNCVCPGIVDTPIHDFHAQPAAQKNQVLSQMANLQPLGRIGSAKEIAEAVYFLASNKSSWTTGAILNVDGGIQLM